MGSWAVVETMLAFWAVQDVEMAMAYAADDIVYSLFVSETVLPFGGVTRGKTNLRNVLYAMLADFDYLQYEPKIVAADKDVVRARVRFTYHHRSSGGALGGSKRLVFTVRGNLVSRIEEYHDARMVEAFMKMAAQRMEAGQVCAPPALPVRGRRRHTRTPRVQPSS